MKFTEYTKEVGFTVRGDITKERAHHIIELLFADDSDVSSVRIAPDLVQVTVMTNDERVGQAKQMLEQVAAIVEAKPFEWREEEFRATPYVHASAGP